MDGEKIGIEFINNDPTGLMHNLAVCAPGSRQKVVASALTIGPKAIEQNFVPDIPEVIASTPQVAPGRKYVLYMVVPSASGNYPYVCTYRMHMACVNSICTYITYVHSVCTYRMHIAYVHSVCT